MAKSKRKLSDINNEYKKQNESYRQTIEFLNQRIRFWFDCYRSLSDKYNQKCADNFPELYASFVVGFILGFAVYLLFKALGGV
jgi:hypothetical protein|nr:MAG TPA: Protein of unknown function (DUF1043) [Caudoviricetes sp.]DAS78111.1 MAG TPA: Protein of unknown function (DUF1043) [Caudoviricetes sp.]